MPRTIVNHTGLSRTQLLLLQKNLPQIIADALDIGRAEENTPTLPKSVSLKFEEAGRYDTGSGKLYIEIFAHNFPERLKNGEQIKDVIGQAVDKMLPKLKKVVILWFVPCEVYIS